MPKALKKEDIKTKQQVQESFHKKQFLVLILSSIIWICSQIDFDIGKIKTNELSNSFMKNPEKSNKLT